jgi:hypothetical protein
MHFFSNLFDKELYMFQTDLLSIIRSLNTVYTAIHASYVDSQHVLLCMHVEFFIKNKFEK